VVWVSIPFFILFNPNLNFFIDVFLGVITSSQFIGELCPREHVYRVLDVEFYSLTTNQYNHIYDNDDTVSDLFKHPCESVMKYLSSGSFYYSPHFDMTKNTPCR
jgi:hypothetical protein